MSNKTKNNTNISELHGNKVANHLICGLGLFEYFPYLLFCCIRQQLCQMVKHQLV